MRNLHLAALLFAALSLPVAGQTNERATRFLDQLRSASPVERAEAVQSLAFIQDARIGPALTRALQDTDRFVRWRAADALGAQRYAAASPDLEKLAAADPYPTVRERAAAALAQIKTTTEYKLYALRSSPDAGERQRAAGELAYGQGTPGIEAALIDSLSDADPGVKATACASLGIRKTQAAVPALAELLRLAMRSDYRVGSAAAEALGRIGDPRAVEPLVRALRGDSVVAGPALKALAALKDPRAVAPIIELQRHDLERNSLEVAFTLKAIGQPGLDGLVAALEARPPLPVEERRAIALAAMYTEDPRIEAGVLRALMDQDPTVRSRLASALGRMKSRKAVDPLLRLVDDADRTVSTGAAGALGLIGDNRASATLARALADPARPHLHDVAVGALGMIGGPAAADALIARLDATRAAAGYDHHRAAQALCSAGGRRARERLLAAARGGDGVTVRGAYRCLIAFGEADTAARIAAALRDAPSHEDQFAAACLASGNAELQDAARAWAQKHGRNLPEWNPHPVRWGSAPP